MKIIGICGSPRKGGNTEILLKEALKGAGKAGAETELTLLSEKKIEFCDGCLECEDTRKCHVDDDMQEIYQKLLETDGIIFSTPVYFDNISSQLKNFIDRTNPLCDKLEGKLIGIIVVGQTDKTSWNRVVQYLKTYSEIMKMKVVGSVSGHGRNIGDIERNKEKLEECRKLGEKIVKSIKC